MRVEGRFKRISENVGRGAAGFVAIGVAGEAFGGPLLFRFVGCPPVLARSHRRVQCQGWASYKPRGRKPRLQPMLARQESDLWGFKVSRVRFTGNFTVRAAGSSMNKFWDVLSNRSSSGSHGSEITAQGLRRKAMTWRRCWPQRRWCCAWHLGAHGRITGGGGARIACPRTKVSTMSMAAPQCAQTNVGRSRTL